MKYNLEKRNDLMYYEGTDELADGHFEYHNEDGSLYCEYSLKEGKYDGACTFYWSNGNTAHEAFFEDGGCSGEIFFYYPNGQIQAIEQFKNNVRHGLCTQFSEDGTIVFNSRYGCSTIPCAFGGLPCLNSQPVAIPAPSPHAMTFCFNSSVSGIVGART